LTGHKKADPKGGIVPAMHAEAATQRMKMINETSDRWAGKLATMGTTWHHRYGNPEAEVVRTRPEDLKHVSIDEARIRIQAIQASMVDDVKKVMEFDSNPVNWQLTDEQRAILQPVHGPDPPPAVRTEGASENS
jgi:hypothetical protein